MQCKQSKKVSKRYKFKRRRQDFAPLEDITLCPALTQSREGHRENFSILMPFLVTCETGVYCAVDVYFSPPPPQSSSTVKLHICDIWNMLFFDTNDLFLDKNLLVIRFPSVLLVQEHDHWSGFEQTERIQNTVVQEWGKGACTVHCAIACVSLSLSLLPDPALLTIFSRSVTVEVSL